MPARETRFSGDDILMRIMAAVSTRAIPLYTILKQITCICITRVNFKLNIKPPSTFLLGVCTNVCFDHEPFV